MRTLLHNSAELSRISSLRACGTCLKGKELIVSRVKLSNQTYTSSISHFHKPEGPKSPSTVYFRYTFYTWKKNLNSLQTKHYKSNSCKRSWKERKGTWSVLAFLLFSFSRLCFKMTRLSLAVCKIIDHSSEDVFCKPFG